MEITIYFVHVRFGDTPSMKNKTIFRISALSAQDAADEARDILRDCYRYFRVNAVFCDCRGEWE